jgi:hypothetical protein
MRYEELFPSRFLRSVDLKGRDATVTIKAIKGEEIEEKMKAIVSFHETKRQWVLNRTNAEALKLMWGPECDDWLNKKVTLYPAAMKDPFGDGEITAIRVRGSPEITKAMNAVIQRGRKTIKVAVIPTGKKGAASAAKPKTPVPVEEADLAEPPDSMVLPGEDAFGDDAP